ncbi:hypothetical protein [Thiolapillus sp.]|uniref:hypothetical protein n=1 Tax=Thiolapillus sp. TaxID=2017437 RepID=UPI0025E4F6EC|nr:hypothetical protein [Thiolapillus sp.]
MTRTAGAPIGCQRPSRFWGLGCPKIYHEAEDTLVFWNQETQEQKRAADRYFIPVQLTRSFCASTPLIR